jgi:hypothetical protein
MVQLNARIDAAVKKVVEEYCRSHGLLINRFVQDALVDRLEELQDVRSETIGSCTARRTGSSL